MIVAQLIAFDIPHVIACRARGLLPWFYKWTTVSRLHAYSECELDEEVKLLFTRLGRAYGSSRITRRRPRWEGRSSPNTVAARMAELAWPGVRPGVGSH
ncbi:hypothetical protein D0T12_04705 [Actinomadura spongiicola]|uniref:Uncharacterized protein n=1 Tax=Actinomadura spongiicola TaxID=2303421 RepID=A0A372GKP0_9ACTN|nr:hypothetical protein D0T12_04705 [Actinomadura spongiicola]